MWAAQVKIHYDEGNKLPGKKDWELLFEKKDSDYIKDKCYYKNCEGSISFVLCYYDNKNEAIKEGKKL